MSGDHALHAAVLTVQHGVMGGKEEQEEGN